MKVVFVSDIHGMGNYAEKIKDIYVKEKFDLLIVLGDLFYCSSSYSSLDDYDPDKVLDILNSFKNNMYIIKGNCDSEIDILSSPFSFLNYLTLNINGKKFFCTHGHLYNLDKFPSEDFDIMVYGHLHVGFIKEINNKLFVNTGSLSFPRGGSVNSYILVDDNTIYLKDLEFNILDKYSL